MTDSYFHTLPIAFHIWKETDGAPARYKDIIAKNGTNFPLLIGGIEKGVFM